MRKSTYRSCNGTLWPTTTFSRFFGFKLDQELCSPCTNMIYGINAEFRFSYHSFCRPFQYVFKVAYVHFVNYLDGSIICVSFLFLNTFFEKKNELHKMNSLTIRSAFCVGIVVFVCSDFVSGMWTYRCSMHIKTVNLAKSFFTSKKISQQFFQIFLNTEYEILKFR